MKADTISKSSVTRRELTLAYLKDKLRLQDGKLYWRSKPSNRIPAGRAGSYDYEGYRIVRILGRGYREHRLIWFYHYGVWPKYTIDHINGIRDDNRIENLRDVSHKVNQSNLAIHRSGHLIGTTYRKERKKRRWVSQVIIRGKMHCIGYFVTREEAHNEYLKYIANEA